MEGERFDPPGIFHPAPYRPPRHSGGPWWLAAIMMGAAIYAVYRGMQWFLAR
jgi:hypothetical protein